MWSNLRTCFYEFKLGHNAADTTKIIYCTKGDGRVYHSNQIVKEILFKLQDNQTKSGRLKSMDSEVVLQVIDCPVGWGCRIY